jgi:GT2 family glycosyltransferase
LETPAKKNRNTAAGVQQPAVAVIILNWRGLEDTRACCDSLGKLTYSEAKVFVVDNASGDGSAEALRSEFPRFNHIQNGKNLGFSGGNNAAMNQLLMQNYKYILLLNNDTVVAPDFIEPLVDAAETDPQIGMVGAKIYYFNSPDVIWYAGGSVDFEECHPFRHIGENTVDHGQYDQPRETGWITGCCLLARSEVLKQIGLLDEAFGYYCEDVHWCLRVKKAGWKIWYQPGSKVWHKIGQSTGRGNLPVLYYNCRNILLIAGKNLNWPQKIKFFLRAIHWVWTYPPKNPEKSGLWEATLDGILGKGGLLTDMGTARWSRAAVLLQMKLHAIKKKILAIFSKT